MNPINGTRNNLLAIFLLLTAIAPASATNYKAFSLKTAEQLLKRGMQETEVRALGGVSKVVGVVYDEPLCDVVLVGEEGTDEQPVGIDELVTALRAVLKYDRSPEVSIDRTVETERTGKQIVRFEGGIDNTRFGKYLLEADVVLKKLGLGKIQAEMHGIRSYFDMCAEDWRQNGHEHAVQSRFWFKPDKERSYAGSRRGVGVIKTLKIKVDTEVTGLPEGAAGDDIDGKVRDEIGEQFASAMTATLEEISDYYTELARLDALFRLTGVAEILKKWNTKNGVSLYCVEFWLERYPLRAYQTPDTYDLLSSDASRGPEGNSRRMVISGGIELCNLVRDIRDGSFTAFKDLVIKSRPNNNVLTWPVPLGPAWDDTEVLDETKCSTEQTIGQMSPYGTLGTTLRREFLNAATPANSQQNWGLLKHELKTGQTMFNLPDGMIPQPRSANIGGVMLQGVAKLAGQQQAQVDLNSGYFSLVVDGKNASLSPGAFRKFVTALWAVYYSNQDPGISIDPISPGVNKHMVRYIGKVINSDLGRVMREADYLMKQWAVGTGRPDIPGFQNPDDIAAQNGVMYVGAMSRFWFVPEDMRFRRAGNLLLFERGRMVVKTEFMFNNDLMRADPANEHFAQFFTEQYTDIAQKYPIYKELFEYAKMVSIAKYLKESGVPLLWFLMANKDLVLTEDSPGTVDALAKGSDYFKNITIEGGVDLATQGHYIYDAEAMKAINEAISKYRSTSTMGTSLHTPDISRSISDRFSFDLAGQAYSVLPQHSLTCGKDRRGIRYQTDVAFRDAGFCLTEQALDELEVRLTSMIMARAAGQSAQLSENASEEQTLRWYRTLQEQAMEQAKPIRECLKELKDRRYPTEQEFGQAIDKALAHSEAADWIKPMVVKQGYYNTILELVRYFNPNQRDCGEFGEGWHLMVPYRIRPADQAKKELNGVLVPEQMVVQNLVTGDCETLTFSTDRYSVVGYVPDRIGKSHVVGLFIMSDASLRLVDKLGNEFWFDPVGRLTDMVFSEHHHTHFEYAKGFVAPFDQAPYRVESTGRDRVQFQGVSLPKTMTVVDNANGSKETLVFEPNGAIVGYTPENQAKTRFRILALLSDLSFRLLDKSGNEVAFAADGSFEGFCPSSDKPVIKSVCVGSYKVGFVYTMGPSGSPMIASARLSKQGAPETLYVMRYEYDDEGRLCRTESTGKRLTGEDGPAGGRQYRISKFEIRNSIF